MKRDCICKDTQLKLFEVIIQKNFLLPTLGDTNVIFDTVWLQSLGTIELSRINSQCGSLDIASHASSRVIWAYAYEAPPWKAWPRKYNFQKNCYNLTLESSQHHPKSIRFNVLTQLNFQRFYHFKIPTNKSHQTYYHTTTQWLFGQHLVVQIPIFKKLISRNWLKHNRNHLTLCPYLVPFLLLEKIEDNSLHMFEHMRDIMSCSLCPLGSQMWKPHFSPF